MWIKPVLKPYLELVVAPTIKRQVLLTLTTSTEDPKRALRWKWKIFWIKRIVFRIPYYSISLWVAASFRCWVRMLVSTSILEHQVYLFLILTILRKPLGSESLQHSIVVLKIIKKLLITSKFEKISLNIFVESEICYKMILYWSSESKYSALSLKNFVN